VDEQSNETEETEVICEGRGESKMKELYQNKLDEEIKGVDFRDTMKHTEKNEQ